MTGQREQKRQYEGRIKEMNEEKRRERGQVRIVKKATSKRGTDCI